MRVLALTLSADWLRAVLTDFLFTDILSRVIFRSDHTRNLQLRLFVYTGWNVHSHVLPTKRFTCSEPEQVPLQDILCKRKHDITFSNDQI